MTATITSLKSIKLQFEHDYKEIPLNLENNPKIAPIECSHAPVFFHLDFSGVVFKKLPHDLAREEHACNKAAAKVAQKLNPKHVQILNSKVATLKDNSLIIMEQANAVEKAKNGSTVRKALIEYKYSTDPEFKQLWEEIPFELAEFALDAGYWDISYGNVLLSPDGKSVTVIDFEKNDPNNARYKEIAIENLVSMFCPNSFDLGRKIGELAKKHNVDLKKIQDPNRHPYPGALMNGLRSVIA